MTAALAVTLGDPGGIGPELIVKAYNHFRARAEERVFFVIATPEIVTAANGAPVEISAPKEANDAFSKGIPTIPLGAIIRPAPGVADPDNAAGIIESIERAVGFALSGEASGVVTNPINKASLIAAGFRFPGHTEFLADLAKDAPMLHNRTRGPAMMIAGPSLRTVPVTIHQSVRDAIASLTPATIIRTAIVTAEALIDDFAVAEPRIAISGLNPHAGEGGALGFEDDAVIAPAVDELKALGINANGPLPADTMFHEEARAGYDAALCMLHDQALIPAKTLNFHDAVNVTLGLPFVRTSPDHGTALGIAGKGLARADSLIASIELAHQLAARRAKASS